MYLKHYKGFPGVYLSYVEKWLGSEGLLKLMEDVADRAARWEYAVSYCRPGEDPVVVSTNLGGRIAYKAKGSGGWATDSIFLPEGESRTIAELLDVANAPLGKWPSRYMPALMQQAAINLFTNQDKSQEVERIFSVNGPPGTGKTTLLKEIIVYNIVERAKLLADYESKQNFYSTESTILHWKLPSGESNRMLIS